MTAQDYTRIELYLSTDGWRWRTKAKNGRIIAASTEACTRRSRAVANLLRVHGLVLADAWINRENGRMTFAQWDLHDRFVELIEVEEEDA